jgi:predicted RNase H-related nuclease YkuK (DUF458 family)
MENKMLTQTQIEDMVDLLIKCNSGTKIYLGCDSVRYIDRNHRQMARYAAVAIVHMNGKNGCRIFSNITRESDFDLKPSRPKIRMMKEVQKVVELYTQLAPFIDEFDIEIHLDINTDPKHGSNCAANEAAGYVLGVTGIQPKLKPESWAASFGADGIVNGRGDQKYFEENQI